MSAAEPADRLLALAGVDSKRQSSAGSAAGQHGGNLLAAAEAVLLSRCLLSGALYEFDKALIRLAHARLVADGIHPLTPAENRDAWLEIAEELREGTRLSMAQRMRLAREIENAVSMDKGASDQAFRVGYRDTKARAWRERLHLILDRFLAELVKRQGKLSMDCERKLWMTNKDPSAARLIDLLEQTRADFADAVRSSRLRMALRWKAPILANGKLAAAKRRQRSKAAPQ